MSGISVAPGDSVYVHTNVGSLQNGQYTMEFFFIDNTNGEDSLLYENCSGSVGAAGQFNLEVNANIDTTSWGTFTDFSQQGTYLVSSNQSGYINTFNWKDFVMEDTGNQNKPKIACPDQYPGQYGDYTMYYNDNYECSY